MRKMLLIALLGLSTSAFAESSAEYVQNVEKHMNFAQFIGVLKCGELRATVEVRSSGVTLGNKSGWRDYDDAVLQAAQKALNAESLTGIMFDVVFSSGRECSSLYL